MNGHTDTQSAWWYQEATFLFQEGKQAIKGRTTFDGYKS